MADDDPSDGDRPTTPPVYPPKEPAAPAPPAPAVKTVTSAPRPPTTLRTGGGRGEWAPRPHQRPAFRYPPGFPGVREKAIENARLGGESRLRKALKHPHSHPDAVKAGVKYATEVFTAFADACLEMRGEGIAGSTISWWSNEGLRLGAADAYHLLRELGEPAADVRNEQLFIAETVQSIKDSEAWLDFLDGRASNERGTDGGDQRPTETKHAPEPPAKALDLESGSEYPTELARNLDALRRESGWTYETLAEMIGVSKTTAMAHVNKGTEPLVETLSDYAGVFSEKLGRPITPADLDPRLPRSPGTTTTRPGRDRGPKTRPAGDRRTT